MELVQEPQLMWLEITVWKLLTPFCGSMCLCGDASGELRDSVSPSACTAFHQDSVRWKMPGLRLTDSLVVRLHVVLGLRWNPNNQIQIQEPKTNAAIFSLMKSWKSHIRKGYGNHLQFGTFLLLTLNFALFKKTLKSLGVHQTDRQHQDPDLIIMGKVKPRIPHVNVV